MSVHSAPVVESGRGISNAITANPSIPSVSSGSMQMSLIALDKLVRIGECGKVSLEPYIPGFEKWDAVAKCDVSLATLRDMFVFQVDHFDLNDGIPEDIRFYVDSTKILQARTVALNSSFVTSGEVVSVNAIGTPLVDADFAVSKDYIKHLANKLFNTPFGADLFINEEALVSSVNSGLASVWESCVNDLQKVSTNGDHASLQGNPNHQYLLRNTDAEDGDYSSRFNICRELLKMLVSRVPERFTNLPSLKLSDTRANEVDPTAENLYSIPLKVGDQMLMRVVLKPCESQSSFKNDAAEDNRIREDKRAYIIALNLV